VRWRLIHRQSTLTLGDKEYREFMTETYPPNLSIDEIKVKIQQTSKNPNIGKTHQVELKGGPRAFRIATIFEIMNPTKNELHHLSLRLDSFEKTKQAWNVKPEKSIQLGGETPNEIKALHEFLSAILSQHYPGCAGDFRLVASDQFKLLQSIAGLLPNLPGARKLELAKKLLESLDASDIDPDAFIDAFQGSSPEAVKYIGVAARFVQYKSAFAVLKSLIESSDDSESKYQNHLKENPWEFGSEYSEILDRRKWTRDDNLDFMLRRTVDNYLEIIEIKTPAVMPLFNYDKSHDSYYASAKLSQVMGQVYRYIEEVERNRDSIIAQDKIDPLKIRARIIIGVDGSEIEQAALRTMNSHLHRVEIITFDQLLRVAKRTLDIFESQISTANRITPVDERDDDIPF